MRTFYNHREANNMTAKIRRFTNEIYTWFREVYNECLNSHCFDSDQDQYGEGHVNVSTKLFAKQSFHMVQHQIEYLSHLEHGPSS